MEVNPIFILRKLLILYGVKEIVQLSTTNNTLLYDETWKYYGRQQVCAKLLFDVDRWFTL